jgi:hypothetical protein
MTGLDENLAAVCCGWTSRDVALGDGKACMGQLETVMLNTETNWLPSMTRSGGRTIRAP